MVWAVDMVLGVIDFAGGLVVHVTCGVAALVSAMIGPRKLSPMPPHNRTMVVIGAAMLWVGWFDLMQEVQLLQMEMGMAMLVTYKCCCCCSCLDVS